VYKIHFSPVFKALSIHIPVWKTCGKTLLKVEMFRAVDLSTIIRSFPDPSAVEKWKTLFQVSLDKGFISFINLCYLCISTYTKRCKATFN